MKQGFNQLDRADDLIPVILYKDYHKPNRNNPKEGMYVSNLYQTLKQVNYRHYDFNNSLRQYQEFEDTLEMFENIDVIERDKNESRVKLNEKGVKIAEKLSDCLEKNKAAMLLIAIKRGKQYEPDY